MPCYHPLYGIFEGYKENGKKAIRIKHEIDPLYSIEYKDDVIIPCGKCLGCRLDYSRRWADRMMLELDSCGGRAVFLTLTYDNDHITWSNFDENGCPINGTLVKRDFQLFMKRLRKALGFKVRFYAAGEYGESSLRPHYHAIIFGLGMDYFSDLKCIGQNGKKQKYYSSEWLAAVWQQGHVLVASVSWATCAYVARYVTKKAKVDLSMYMESCGMLPEFSLSSRRPGIGAFYLQQHPDCLDYSTISLSTPEGGKEIKIPKYFLRKIEKDDPEEYTRRCQLRAQAAKDSMYLKSLRTDFSYLEFLELEEDAKYRAIKGLSRPL